MSREKGARVLASRSGKGYNHEQLLPLLAPPRQTDSLVQSNLFSIRFDDSDSPSAEVVVPGRDAPVREYLAGPENALLGHVIASDSKSNFTDHPILMFGPTGVGKSHLLRGMADRHQASQPAARVRLQNGSDFCRELSQAHEVGSLSDIRQQLRNLDYLALDDVHLLAEKAFAQVELLNLLDGLKDRHATVVHTSVSH